jgi:hypothetical protein
MVRLLAAALCTVGLAAPGLGQNSSTDSDAARARTASVAVETRQAILLYAQKSVLCDKFKPGVWDQTKLDLQRLPALFWGKDDEAKTEATLNRPEMIAALEDVKQQIADHRETLANMQAECLVDVMSAKHDVTAKLETLAFMGSK